MINNHPIQAIDIRELLAKLQDEVKKTVRVELQNITKAKPSKQLLTLRETATEFGMTESYWRKQVFNRNIPFVKMGKSVRLKRKDIEEFIENNKID